MEKENSKFHQKKLRSVIYSPHLTIKDIKKHIMLMIYNGATEATSGGTQPLYPDT